jgi:RNA-directed DNA polymerase
VKHSPYPLRVRELLTRQHNRCPICKRQFNILDSTTWEVDHILPRFAGGKDQYCNLQLLHKECHEKKTVLDMQLYRQEKAKRKNIT